jgi:hypothetical protein
LSKDTKEIAVTETRSVQSTQASQLLVDIVQASRDPAVDANKIKVLADLAMSMQDREAERRFSIAMHAAIMEMPTISKRGAILGKGGNVQSRYSKYEDIMKAIKPILDKHRLIVKFNVDHEGLNVIVQPVVTYSDGEMAFTQVGGKMSLPIDNSGSKNPTQGVGSSRAYGQRHQLKATFNIVEENEDTDGQTEKPELSDRLLNLIEEARTAARQGIEAYKAYFEGLPVEDKVWLTGAVEPSGLSYHETNKQSAKRFEP